MKRRNMFILLITAIITMFIMTIIYNYDDIYIEVMKRYMFEKGKVSDKYIEFVIGKKGEMKIHEIANYGDKIGKNKISTELYNKTAEYYIKKKKTTEILEVFCSRLDRTKYLEPRQICYREILLRKKEELKKILPNKEVNQEEKNKKIDAILRYVASTDEQEKNIDIIQDIALMLTDKNDIYIVYTYLVDFYQNSKNPYKKDVLKMMESNLAGRLTQQDIDRVFGRK